MRSSDVHAETLIPSVYVGIYGSQSTSGSSAELLAPTHPLRRYSRAASAPSPGPRQRALQRQPGGLGVPAAADTAWRRPPRPRRPPSAAKPSPVPADISRKSSAIRTPATERGNSTIPRDRPTSPRAAPPRRVAPSPRRGRSPAPPPASAAPPPAAGAGPRARWRRRRDRSIRDRGRSPAAPRRCGGCADGCC